jgi:hypothetical protein
MIGKPIERTRSAYGHPLLIGGLLKSGVTRAPEQQIAYADKRRMTYRELGERVGRLASALAGLGVRPGHNHCSRTRKGDRGAVSVLGRCVCAASGLVRKAVVSTLNGRRCCFILENRIRTCLLDAWHEWERKTLMKTMTRRSVLCSSFGLAGITRPQRSNDPVRLPPWPPPRATLRPLPSPATGLPL